MPLYEYRCRACGHRGEALVSYGEAIACGECGGSDTERLIGAPGAVSYYGWGTYTTDYKHVEDPAWPCMEILDRRAWNRGQRRVKRRIPLRDAPFG